MPLQISTFPVKVGTAHVSFHDGFNDPRSGGTHQAVDIGGPVGLRIVSTTAGRVVRSWRTHHDRREPLPGVPAAPQGRGGNWVLIIDANNNVHYYAHMLRPAVAEGASVTAGADIGLLGNTGAALRHPHLHYQVWNANNRTAAEIASLEFTGPFGAAINPYFELVRVSGRTAGASGGVIFNAPAHAHRGHARHAH
jgi:murein DD-endopeptidase MepM/ murein hydrolase activator NlpD